MVIKNTKISLLPKPGDVDLHSAYLELTSELQRSPKYKLRLIIDCSRYQLMSYPESGLIGVIGGEVKAWSSAIGPRIVQSLYLIHPYKYLEPFELTRLLYEIASQFKISSCDYRTFVIVSELDEINSESLALVKGLGFNRYQILVEDKHFENIDVIGKKLRWIKEFSFNEVGLQIIGSESLIEMRSIIRHIEHVCKPDYICFGKTWDSLKVLSSANHIECDVVDTSNTDVIELGSEGRCKIGEHKIQNYSSPEKYRASLDMKRLPIHTNSFRQNR